MGTPTHFKIVFRGVFVGTEETWSFGTHWSRGTPGTDATLTDLDETAIDNAIGGLIAVSGTAQFSDQMQVTEWRAYQIGTDGLMEGNPLLRVLASPVGGLGTNRFPPQIALVVTTVAEDRGPARLGRFFLPGPTAATTGHVLSESNANLYLDAATVFVKAVSDAINNPVPLASTSMVNISDRPAPTGTKKEVHHLEIGHVYDTLRSRRRALVEDRIVGGAIDW